MSLFRGCSTARIQARGFASSPNLRVGPESPNYIDVPRSIQPYIRGKQPVKGTLPVPREIFPARRRDKPSQAYIAAATTPPKNRNTKLSGAQAEYRKWKDTMAEVRRQNLREGLLELHSRKQQTDHRMTKRGHAKQIKRDRILRQPEREDERLTRPTVLDTMLPGKIPVLPDPDRKERLAQSKATLDRRETDKRMERLDQLHVLYMNARNYITTESQLNAEIENAFPEGVNEAWRSDSQTGDSIWNLGLPRSIESMANAKGIAQWDIAQERIKKLGEQISGGKL